MSDAFPHSRGQSSQVDRPDRSRPLFSVTLIATVMLSIGWIYPEHREITVRAIQQLDQERRRTLDTMWMLACLGHESRLSTLPADDTEQVNPGTIDYASWPAIAGDHSRSAANMVDNVLETEWILRVAAIAAEHVFSGSTSKIMSSPVLRRIMAKIPNSGPVCDAARIASGFTRQIGYSTP